MIDAALYFMALFLTACFVLIILAMVVLFLWAIVDGVMERLEDW